MQEFTGKTYLKIDIANNFGLDKKTWNERIEWFDAHEPELEELLPQADEPALYFAGVQAWRDTQAGKPSGYPISLDATSSGMQILAALTGDRSAAELCNVVNVMENGAPARRDGYTVIYKQMVAELGEAARIIREDVKQAIMTALYGSKAEPKRVFGEGILLNTFEQIMALVAPAVWELNQFFLDMWNPERTINSWVLPDNFHVHVKVMDRVKETVHFMNKPYETFRNVNQPTEEGRSLGANTTHSVDGMIVREMIRRCNYDPLRISDVWQILMTDYEVYLNGPDHDDMVKTLWQHYQDTGYLSARILDHLDSNNIHLVERKVLEDLLLSLPEKSFEVVAVHDCFRCLPNYGNDLRRQYTLQLQLIAKSNLLQNLLSQLLGRNITIAKLDETLWQDVGLAEYALS